MRVFRSHSCWWCYWLSSRRCASGCESGRSAEQQSPRNPPRLYTAGSLRQLQRFTQPDNLRTMSVFVAGNEHEPLIDVELAKKRVRERCLRQIDAMSCID